MYKDIISYKLAPGISEEHLVQIANRVVETWMGNQPGFIKWEIHKNKAGDYTDIVSWKSKKDAKNSEADMVNIPNAPEWFACYQEGSIISQNLDVIATLTGK